MNKNIIISIIVSFIIIIFAMYAFSKKTDDDTDNTGGILAQNVYIEDGIQYVNINARGGYSPKISIIKPDIPTKLIIKTNGTYDCSSSLSIPSLGIRKMLQATGEEVIDLGLIESGKVIDGTCSMGMYRFQIKTE